MIFYQIIVFLADFLPILVKIDNFLIKFSA